MLTKSASNQVIAALKQRGQGLGIRIAVKPSGCNGYKYLLEYVDQAAANDLIITIDSVTIFVDPESLPYVENLTLDWQRRGLNQGFEFINPLEESRCGCGQSFSVTPAAE